MADDEDTKPAKASHRMIAWMIGVAVAGGMIWLTDVLPPPADLARRFVRYFIDMPARGREWRHRVNTWAHEPASDVERRD